MITISNIPLDTLSIRSLHSNNSLQSYILNSLNQIDETVNYESIDELKFELQLRAAIVDSSIKLSQSNMGFATFRESKCNSKYWKRLKNGGFQVLPNVKSSDAIMDIYHHGSLYATECATAMVIVLYRALLMVFDESLFNEVFPQIYLMNWHNLDPKIADMGYLVSTTYYLPGDRRYFYNPEVSHETPEWQGENSIQLINEKFYAHDFGIVSANEIIEALNNERKSGATQTAFLKKGVGRPDFHYLFQLKNSMMNPSNRFVLT